jgi:hypothetical protein
VAKASAAYVLMLLSSTLSEVEMSGVREECKTRKARILQVPAFKTATAFPRKRAREHFPSASFFCEDSLPYPSGKGRDRAAVDLRWSGLYR